MLCHYAWQLSNSTRLFATVRKIATLSVIGAILIGTNYENHKKNTTHGLVADNENKTSEINHHPPALRRIETPAEIKSKNRLAFFHSTSRPNLSQFSKQRQTGTGIFPLLISSMNFPITVSLSKFFPVKLEPMYSIVFTTSNLCFLINSTTSADSDCLVNPSFLTLFCLPELTLLYRYVFTDFIEF